MAASVPICAGLVALFESAVDLGPPPVAEGTRAASLVRIVLVALAVSELTRPRSPETREP